MERESIKSSKEDVILLAKRLIPLFIFSLLLWQWQIARALDTSKSFFLSNYYYNSLVSDSDFVNINSYSENDIQNFLVSKGSYLKDYEQNGRRAARIIYDAAHGYGEATGTLNGIAIDQSTGTINPKAIIVTLQKEQSLVTEQTRNDGRLDHATGYACPDSSSCDSRYLGFTKQVENAAWQLRYNYERAQGHGFSDYQVNQIKSFSDPSGSYGVTFSNRATASLYRYTPHVFNGNYNFWKLMIEYFGTTPPVPSSSSLNDDSSVESKTYKNKFKIEGSKTTDSSVYFDGRQIAGTGSNHWSLEFEPSVGNHDYSLDYRTNGGVVATKNIKIDRHREGDVNGDGKVDLLDISLLSNAWARNVPDGDWINLNPDTDSEVNILDLSILSSNWNK